MAAEVMEKTSSKAIQERKKTTFGWAGEMKTLLRSERLKDPCRIVLCTEPLSQE